MAEKSGKNWFARHKVLTGIIIFFVLVGIAGALGDDKKPETKANNTSTTSQQATAPAETKQEAPKAEEPKVPAEYKSALNKATSYSSTQHMSKRGVYDQLTSEYGEKFSAEAAQYAIDNVKADWNANALAKAKSYQSQQSMSPAAIRDQLVSDYGEKFTAAEADYAIAHLND